MASEPETAAMRRALWIGAAVAGSTSPNPPVGAVILDRDGQPAGEGGTRPPGQEHAEVLALAAAGDRARGGTAVVTLEPCAHTGRTGPCVDALLTAGIARVVYAVDDPDPVAGGGAHRLRASGVQVESGVLAREAGAGALEPWLFATRHRRPYVTWKFAATLDGRVAASDGSSQWITGEAARADVHRLRGTVDAIAVGVGTVLADDPLLTVRDSAAAPPPRRPLRVVFDSRGRIPPTARVLGPDAPTLVVIAMSGPAARGAAAGPHQAPTGHTTPALVGAALPRAASTADAPRVGAEAAAVPEEAAAGLTTRAVSDGALPRAASTAPGEARAGVETIGVPAGADGRIDVPAALRALFDRGVRHLLVEGGPTLAGGFARVGCVDRVVAYLAPALLGAGPAALGPAGIDTIGSALRLDMIDVARLGADLRLTGRPHREGSSGR